MAKNQQQVPIKTPLWLEDLRPGADSEGFMEKNLHHSLMFVRRPSDRLLVTFDNLSNVNDSALDRGPWAYKVARDGGHSHLGVMAHVSDWYRNDNLIKRFQALAAEGFFNGYARVLFAGVSMGAFAALKFSALVPGAHVVAINPQSTLDPDLVPWENRFKNGQRQDWKLPFPDSAALTATAERVNLFYDPYHALDKKHINRFSGYNVRVFNCWFSSHKTAVFLRKIGALKPIMNHAIMDEITEREFYSLYRARRNLPWYRGAVSDYFRNKGRKELADSFDVAFRQRLRANKAIDGAPKTLTETTSQPKVKVEMEASNHARIRMKQAKSAARSATSAPAAESRIIVTTMKNEAPFMLEWVAYNRMIGFTGFLIYTNDCEDGTDSIARRLEELGFAQHRTNPFKPGGSPQRSALNDAGKQEIIQNADWVICADCDEFLNIRVGQGRLDDLFAAVGDVDAISVCWKLFGNSGRVTYSDSLVIEQFDRSCAESEYPNYRAYGMKTLVRNNDHFRKLRIHRPAFHLDRGDIAWVDGGGQLMPDAYLEKGWKAFEGFSHTYARLHHYAVRSVDSFLVKRDRGRTNHVKDDQGLTYWRNMNYNSSSDTSIFDRAPGVRKELANLLQDAELARLHVRAVQWHREKIEDLRRRDGWDDFRQAISTINAAPQAQKG